MKVLVITHKPPFPKIDGGCWATAQTISGLDSSNVELKIALISTPKHPFHASAFPSTILEKIAVSHFIETDSWLHKIRGFFSTQRSIFTQRFYDKTFSEKLVHLCETFKPDIVHFESLFAATYLDTIKKVSSAKLVLRSHNVEHQLWTDRLKSSNPITRLLLNPQVRMLRREEFKIFQEVDGVVAIAQSEIEIIERQKIRTKTILIPTGISANEKHSQYSNDFFHLAAMDWQPNVRGLNWFLKEVWRPENEHKKNILHLAGKNLLQEDYREFRGIKNHGSIQDSQDFMIQHGIMLVPLLEGSGLRIKIIESGALGVPIIATSKAVEGIGLAPNQHYLEANNPHDFQHAMKLLSNDVSLRQIIGAAIRKFMIQNYNQDNFNNQLIEFYKSI